jgi:hypothetical protein
MEFEGSNYLVPIDAKLEWDLDIEDETAVRLPPPARPARPQPGSSKCFIFDGRKFCE